MSFEEKVTWVSVVVSAAVAAVYFSVVFGQLGHTPVAEIAYQKPMLIAIGAMIGMTIVGTIAMAVGTAVSAEVLGNGSVKDIDRKDERDVSIGRRGDLFGYYVSSVGVFAALVLTMLKFDYFWIANAILMSFLVASFVSSVVKIAAYRRGF
jgi:hypothetical protein